MTLAQSTCQPLQTRVRARRHTFANFVALYREWQRRARGRAELAALGDRQLRDIGLTRCDAAREIGKPFWRA